MLTRLFVTVSVSISAAIPAAAETFWVAADEYDRFHVVIGIDATESDYWAAHRFRIHWNELTGHDVTVSRRPKPGGVNIWVGTANNPFASRVRLDELDEEGFVVQTIPAKKIARYEREEGELAGKHLVLAGAGIRGTLYAEWEFFEAILGVRAFVPEMLVWPEPPSSLPTVDVRHVPAFRYRDISYRAFLIQPWFAHAHRLNGISSGISDSGGGHTRYVRGQEGFGHTFHYFVDPDEYFDAHPEYFAEIDGERAKYAQLCLTNPDVLGITIQKARDLLREAKLNEDILSISQMDYHWFDSWCTCTNCKAIDDREGSHSGTILHFVNQVADAIAKEFPNTYIDTLAYMYSRKPPKHLKPRDNVIVRLCAIECDYSRPLDDRRSPRNRAFARDLKKWSRITETLFVWDYTQNWFSFQGPHPNIHVLQPNIAFFARHGVDGVFEQASPRIARSDFEQLKGYILAKSLWDPDVGWKGLYREFLDAYYGDASPYVDEYLQLVTERVKRDDVVLTIENRMTWMDSALVEQAQEIFARAFAAVDDETALERLKYAYLPVQYAALVCPPRVYQGDDAYILTRPASQTFDEYRAMLQEYRIRFLNDYPIEEFWERLDGTTPPRYETVAIEKLSNEHLELWVLPSRGGAAVRLLDRLTGHEWLAGHEDILSVRGRMQEWAVLDSVDRAAPRAVEEAYTVVEKGSDYIVLRALLKNGLEVQREIRLVPEARAVDVALRVVNQGDASIEPQVELYPEFTTAGLGKPQRWVERDGAWSKEPLKGKTSTRVYTDQVSVEGLTRWAFRFPKAHITLLGTVDEEALEFLSYVYVRDAYIGMGQTLARFPLEPGESREMRTRFELSDSKPGAL